MKGEMKRDIFPYYKGNLNGSEIQNRENRMLGVEEKVEEAKEKRAGISKTLDGRDT